MKRTIIFILSISAMSCFDMQRYDKLPATFKHCQKKFKTERSNYKLLCLDKSYILMPISTKNKNNNIFEIFLSGGHPRKKIKQDSDRFDFEYVLLNLNHQFIDGTKNRSLYFRGHNTTISNGILLNFNKILFGSEEYYAPNFAKNIQENNLAVEKQGFIYANNDFNCLRYTVLKCTDSKLFIENFYLNNLNIRSNKIIINSWGATIKKNIIQVQDKFQINGSTSRILNNYFIGESPLIKKKIFNIKATTKTNLLSVSTQIFPDLWDDPTDIQAILYIKFSPDTIIDGNHFILTQPNEQNYAIVLDHSPRVRISNNTFNGFKVPILMDQWSSIVDEHGNEIKAEDFTGHGNIIYPDKFAGHVNMNRKGEIILE